MSRSFKAQYDAEVKRILQKTSQEVVETAATAAYESILQSDVSQSADRYWSGYFHANQGINIDGKSDFDLQPDQRRITDDPFEIKNEYVHLIESRKQKELMKLKQFDLSKSNVVKVGTAVEYGENVGFSKGLGNQIYAKARDEASEAAKAKTRSL